MRRSLVFHEENSFSKFKNKDALCGIHKKNSPLKNAKWGGKENIGMKKWHVNGNKQEQHSYSSRGKHISILKGVECEYVGFEASR